jgi:hypothetical protein
MKKALAFRNFFLNNTPEKAQLIGDICMILGFLAGLPAFINEIAATQGMTIALPVIIITASKWAAIALLAIKGFTKFIGIKNIPTNEAGQ